MSLILVKQQDRTCWLRNCRVIVVDHYNRTTYSGTPPDACFLALSNKGQIDIIRHAPFHGLQTGRVALARFVKQSDLIERHIEPSLSC